MQIFGSLKTFVKQRYTAIVRVAVMMLFSLFLSVLCEWVVRDNFRDAIVWAFDRFPAFIITSITFFFLTFFLFTLFRRIDFPILIISLLFFTMSAASFFKYSYRSEPLYPWDLGIISEAADISSEMDLSITSSMLLALLIILFIFVLLLFAHIFLKKKGVLRIRKPDKKRKKALVIQSAVSFVVLTAYIIFTMNFGSILSVFGISESAFRQPQAYKRNGLVQSFVMNTKYLLPDIPEGYSQKSVNEIVQSINKDESTDTVKPNIIMLMSESYADISLCENVTFHDDIFANINLLKQNFVSGTLLGEQFGGGTCNSEFEVLTGFSMNYLPTGCTPYQQYANSKTVSYAWFLKELGYNTVAIHSYGKQFWNRDVAYPNLGFDKFISEEDFVEPLRRRGLIKDDELVKMIIQEYEANKETGKPFFNFSVSMQNHGSFTNGQYLEDYRTRLSCDALNEEQEGILITYATGIRDANIALNKLIHYFANVNEPTIICMFGDHLGSLGGNDDILIKSGYMKDPSVSAEEASKKYTTPFFIWDNYTTNVLTAPKMSFYQLIPSICSWYNLDRPLFYDYLLTQQDTFRGAAFNFRITPEGSTLYEMSDDAKKAYNTHKLLQYDLLFGKGYGKEALYSLN